MSSGSFPGVARQCPGLTAALCSAITPSRAWGVLWGAREVLGVPPCRASALLLLLSESLSDTPTSCSGSNHPLEAPNCCHPHPPRHVREPAKAHGHWTRSRTAKGVRGRGAPVSNLTVLPSSDETIGVGSLKRGETEAPGSKVSRTIHQELQSASRARPRAAQDDSWLSAQKSLLLVFEGPSEVPGIDPEPTGCGEAPSLARRLGSFLGGRGVSGPLLAALRPYSWL